MATEAASIYSLTGKTIDTITHLKISNGEYVVLVFTDGTKVNIIQDEIYDAASATAQYPQGRRFAEFD